MEVTFGINVRFHTKALMQTVVKSKKITQLMLVEAGTVKEAYDNLAENMSNLMVDYKVISVAESPIIEVFYPKENEKRVEPTEEGPIKGMIPNTDFAF